MSRLRFPCDENIPRDLGLVAQLEGYDVNFAVDFSRGEIDQGILERAQCDSRILVTEDADFGRLIFSDGLASQGVVFLRIAPWKRQLRRLRFQHLLRRDGHRIAGHFTVLQERTIRIRPISHGE